MTRAIQDLPSNSVTIVPHIAIELAGGDDCVEVYAELKRAGRAAPTIIITASGPQYRDTVEAMRDVAITGILNKPFDPMSLLGRLEQLAA
jgi:DNA-binding NtrC family response regulator